MLADTSARTDMINPPVTYSEQILPIHYSISANIFKYTQFHPTQIVIRSIYASLINVNLSEASFSM